MFDQGEFSLSTIKSEPNTDDISYTMDKINVEESLNEVKFEVGLDYGEGVVKQEEDIKSFMNIKQEELHVKDEIPIIHNTFDDNNQDVEQNKELVNLLQSHAGFNIKRKQFFVRYIISKKKPFTCNLWEYKTARKSCLTIHMKYHTGERKAFSCYMCGFITSRKERLKHHIRTHSGAKSFACNLCNFKTHKIASLNNHRGANHWQKFVHQFSISENLKKFS